MASHPEALPDAEGEPVVQTRPAGRVDFFVSHAGTDEDWAAWIAQELENASYTVELDVWHWSAGIDVIDAMGAPSCCGLDTVSVGEPPPG